MRIEALERLEDAFAQLRGDSRPPIHHAQGQAAGVALDANRDRAPLRAVSNAVRHSPEGSAIAVRVESDAGRLTLRVVDRGPGVPAELRERIFEPFERFDPHSGLGTGLGLPVSRRLAEVLGGALRVAETPGGGATFELLLPLAPPA